MRVRRRVSPPKPRTNPAILERTTAAHIAALAAEHGYTVYSNDADFGRFPSVKWVNPLIQRSILLNPAQ